MTQIKAVGEVVEKVSKAIDDNFESGEERQEQLSHRHEMDMINGTWLTKNIRPLALFGLLIYWLLVIPLFEAFDILIRPEVISAVKELSWVAFSFYFGSKGFEKVQVIKAKMERRKERRNKK